jgi:hypothetical protein
LIGTDDRTLTAPSEEKQGAEEKAQVNFHCGSKTAKRFQQEVGQAGRCPSIGATVVFSKGKVGLF